MAVEYSRDRLHILPEWNTSNISIDVEIKPKGDDWILDNIKDHPTEVISFMRKRLDTVQAIYQKETGSSKETARILAYIELCDEYNSVGIENSAKAANLRSQFDEEKRTIQLGSGSQGRKSKKIQERWRVLEGDFKRYVDASENAREIKKIILGEAIVDIFSAESEFSGGIATMTLPNVLQEVQAVQYTDPRFIYLAEKKSLNQFTEDLTSALEETNSKSVLFRLDYRQSPDLISTVPDAKLLANALRMCAEKDRGFLRVNYNRLGRAYLNLLVKRASAVSDLPPEVGNYPYLSLMHDIYVASLFENDFQVIANTEEVIQDMFGGCVRSQKVEKETARMVSNQAKEEVDFCNALSSLSPTKLIQINTDIINERFDLVPQPMRDLVLYPEWRLRALKGVNTSLGGKVGKYLNHMLEKYVVLERKRSSAEWIYAGDAIKIAESWDAEQIKKRLNHEINLHLVSGANIQFINLLRGNKKSSMTNIEVSPGIFLDNGGFLALDGIEDMSLEDHVKLDKQNKILWREVLDKATWFVSPRGDRFSAQHDPELVDLNCESITFNVDKRHPREHKIIAKETGGIVNTFWLTKERMLLGENRKPLYGDPRATEKLKNILLTRLYYITSGVMSTSVKRDSEPGFETVERRYVRAFYRFLHSTDTKTYSLQSPDALRHKEEIKQVYGIDLDQENERRKMLGTLKWEDYITFVKEQIPEDMALTANPNEIVYDPTLVNIPTRYI